LDNEKRVALMVASVSNVTPARPASNEMVAAA
jgi:hypothetical protein